MSSSLSTAALCAVCFVVFPSLAIGAPPEQPCAGPLDRGAVVRCAVAASLDVRLARQELKVIAGRRVTAGLWLPSNPIVSLTAAGRIPPRISDVTGTFFNWYVTLSQEIEIAGQRWARLDVVDAEAAAQVRRVAVAEREVGALALRTYLELLAAQAALALAVELAGIGDTLGQLAEERAKEALLAPVDADVARAEAVRLGLLRFAAERRLATARAQLTVLVGGDAAAPLGAVEGALAIAPPTGPAPSLNDLVERAVTLRGEIAAAEAEQIVVERQVRSLRRARAPNLTLSAFAQRDGFNEQVYGGGLSLPLPLPAPVGQTLAGEIAVARAQGERTATTVERIRRRVRLEVVEAHAAERATAAALKVFPLSLMERAPTSLRALREALALRQMSLREALLAERALVELLVSQIEAQLAHALAVVELARASGGQP